MNMGKGMKRLDYWLLCAVLVTAGCGKGEKSSPKAAQPAAVPKAAPVATQQVAKAAESTPAATNPAALGQKKKFTRTPEQIKADEESMRAARARSYEYAQKTVKNAIDMTSAAMEKSSADLLSLVQKIREQSPVARDAFAARQKAEAECERLIKDAPGMAELRARMENAQQDFFAAAAAAGNAENQEKAREALMAVHQQMVQVEAEARKAGGEYARACEARDAAAKAYDEELSRNEEYQAMLQQRVKFQDQYNGLVARLAELVKQEKQRP